jgi:hypothetical protein
MDAIAPELCARIPPAPSETVRANTLRCKNGTAGFALLARWPITGIAYAEYVVNVILMAFIALFRVFYRQLTLFNLFFCPRDAFIQATLLPHELYDIVVPTILPPHEPYDIFVRTALPHPSPLPQGEGEWSPDGLKWQTITAVQGSNARRSSGKSHPGPLPLGEGELSFETKEGPFLVERPDAESVRGCQRTPRRKRGIAGTRSRCATFDFYLGHHKRTEMEMKTF